MVTLDGSVRLVGMQFSFSNINIVPESLKKRELESLEERNERKTREGSGEMVITLTENSSLAEFLNDLEVAGYELVDTFYQPRVHPKNPRIIYHMMRFLFARHEYADPSEEFKGVRNAISAELLKICEQAMWRVRAYLNPFFTDNEQIPGYHALSINLKGRKPLFLPDGQPVVVWQKDKEGNRVGDAPLSLRPDYHLRIDTNAIQLVVEKR